MPDYSCSITSPRHKRRLRNLTDEQILIWLLRQSRRNENGCLICDKSILRDGYAHIGVRGKLIPAHRFVYTTIYGKLDSSVDTRHTCDVRNCIAPGHLTHGSRKQNMQDAIDRKRIATGQQSPNAKLNISQVRQIRNQIKQGRRLKLIANDFNVSPSLISAIKLNYRWKHDR